MRKRAVESKGSIEKRGLSRGKRGTKRENMGERDNNVVSGILFFFL